MGKKIFIYLVSATLLCGVFLSACGKDDSGGSKVQNTSLISTTNAPVATPEPDGASSELKADITMWVYPTFEKIDQFFNEKVNTEFKKKFPGINVTTEIIPWDGGPNKVNVAIASGTTPDILADGPIRTNGYAEKGVLVPLDKEIEDLKGKILPGAISTNKINDHLYIYPSGSVNSGYTMAVNITLAKELGVYDMLPKDYVSWTQEEFKSFIAAATEKGKAKGIYGTALWAGSQSSDSVYYSFLMSAGANVFDQDKKKIVLNSPEAVKSLDLLASMVKEKLVVPGATTLKDEDSNTLFFNKKIVVEMTSGMWNYTEVEKQIKDKTIEAPFDIELYEFPSIDGKSVHKTSALPSAFVIFKNKNDENKIKAAKEYLNFFLNDQSLVKEYGKNSGWLIAIPGVTTYEDNPGLEKEAQKALIWDVTSGDREYGIQKPYWGEIRGVFYPEIQSVYSGAKTSQQALDDFVMKANEIASKNEK